MVDENGFRQWLVVTKGFKQKTAGDVLSRCRRVERVLGVSLSEASQPEDIDGIRMRLKRDQIRYLPPEAKPIYAVAVLQRAVELYGEYIGSKKA